MTLQIAADSGNTSDPYIVLKYEGKAKHTSVISRSLEPIWRQLILFDTCSQDMSDEMEVLAFDHDYGSRDDSMGTGRLSLRGIKVGIWQQIWVKLLDANHPSWKGKVLLEYTLLPKRSDQEKNGLLSLKIVR